MLFKLLILTLGVSALAQRENYKGYKLYNVYRADVNQSEFLHQLPELFGPGIDILSAPPTSSEPAATIVSPILQDTFETLLKEQNISYNVSLSDLSELVEREHQEQIKPTRRGRTGGSFIGFQKFYRYDEITKYLDELQQVYPQRVAVKSIGKSYEKRDIKMITISNGKPSADKKVIFIEAGIHAREWMAPATALYLIHQLVEKFEANKALLEDYDWKIVPSINPDGYEYSHTKKRFWRKTVRPNILCDGTDGNRNFDIHWAEVGVSHCECSDIYAGPSAFSEPETRALRDTLQEIKGSCKFFLSLHSHGSYILLPWGHTKERPSNFKDLFEVAENGAMAAKQKAGHTFKYGGTLDLLYAAAGSSHDYALSLGIPISMTIELPSRKNAQDPFEGFDPRPSEILPFAKIAWTTIKAMAETVQKKFA